MIKNSCLLIVVSCCLNFNISSSSNEQTTNQSLRQSTSFTDLTNYSPEPVLACSNSVISLTDENPGTQSAMSPSIQKQPYRQLHYMTTTFAGRSNTTYLQHRDADGTLLPTLEQEPVRAQSLFNSAFSDRFSKPVIEDEENQNRLAAIIAIGKKYSRMLSEHAQSNPNYDSDDSDDQTPIQRSQNSLTTIPQKPTIKLELAPNLAQLFIGQQQSALLKKLKEQRIINAQLIETKSMLFKQAAEQEATTKQSADQEEQNSLEAIDAERKFYCAKWESQTKEALELKTRNYTTAATTKKESYSAAQQYYDVQIMAMSATAGIIAANLRYIKTKADGDITIPFNVHKKANYKTSQAYLQTLDRIPK